MSPRAIAACALNIPGCGAGTGARTVPPSRPFLSLARTPAMIPFPTKGPYMPPTLLLPSYRMMPDGGTPSDTSARHTALTTATLGWLSPRQLSLTAALTLEPFFGRGLPENRSPCLVRGVLLGEAACQGIHVGKHLLRRDRRVLGRHVPLPRFDDDIFGSRQLTTRRLSMCGLICFPGNQPLFRSKALAGNALAARRLPHRPRRRKENRGEIWNAYSS